MFNVMLHAFEKANLVDPEKARQIEKDKAINEVVNENARLGRLKAELKKHLKELVHLAAGDPEGFLRKNEIEARLKDLQSRYSEVFDEVCTQTTYDTYLGRL